MTLVNRLIALLLIIVHLAASASSATQVVFPAAPTTVTVNSAQKIFNERSVLITRYNACGREFEYYKHRMELAHKNFERQGDMLSILIAKIAWLTDPRFGLGGRPCDYHLQSTWPLRDQFGKPLEIAKEAWLAEELGPWNDAVPPPTGCSIGSSNVTARVLEDTAIINANFRVEAECLRKQVNEAIRVMEKHSQMGTDDLPCITEPQIATGDFDFVVRDLVRILYMGTLPRREVLDRSTIDYMYDNLLAARGKLSDASYSVLTDCVEPAGDELGSPEEFADRESWTNEFLEGIGDTLQWLAELFLLAGIVSLIPPEGFIAAPFIVAALGGDPLAVLVPSEFDIRVPETENHRLMIEISKYLTNEKIIAELRQMNHDNVDEIKEKQNGVRDWILQDLQRIAINDFDEYNSRPYSHLSLNAIQNLYDFAPDNRLRTASQIVLDLSGAKFAAGSNRGRRVVPFRRLAKNDIRPLYGMIDGADHEIARAIVYTGQTQLLETGVLGGGVASMALAAVSSYRWPMAAVETAIERTREFDQEILHAGVEGYYSSPAFTMSLGGVQRPAALNLLGIENPEDRGAAVPTVIIPTSLGTQMEDLFAINGVGVREQRSDNLCGWHGFICGVSPAPIPENFLQCTKGYIVSSGPDYFFVNSAGCPKSAAGPHFYLALKRMQCRNTFCQQGRESGLIEIVEAPAARSPIELDSRFETFMTSRRAALEAAIPNEDGVGTYITVAGDIIQFQIHENLSRIVTINGSPRPEFATRGAVLNADKSGHSFISSPSGRFKVTIDYSRWDNPQRIEAP